MVRLAFQEQEVHQKRAPGYFGYCLHYGRGSNGRGSTYSRISGLAETMAVLLVSVRA